MTPTATTVTEKNFPERADAASAANSTRLPTDIEWPTFPSRAASPSTEVPRGETLTEDHQRPATMPGMKITDLPVVGPPPAPIPPAPIPHAPIAVPARLAPIAAPPPVAPAPVAPVPLADPSLPPMQPASADPSSPRRADLQEIPVPGLDDSAAERPEGDAVAVELPEVTTATASGRIVWIAAVLAALLLVGGGAFFAVRSFSDQGGADSPEAAVSTMLAALNNEDILTAATLIEPTERRTLAEPGLEIVAELRRLGILSADLNTSAVQGIDLEYANPILRSVAVTNDLTHVYMDGGEFTGSYSMADLPLGPAIRDRLPAEMLRESDTWTESAGDTELPIAVVQRDGRWYISLWYSLAGAVVADAGAEFPVDQPPVARKGSATPELAIEGFVDDALALDLAGVIGHFDPEEAAALYDYAPLFLADVDRMAEHARRQASRDGWTWSIDQMELGTQIDGRDAKVQVARIAGAVRGQWTNVVFNVTRDAATIDGIVDGERISAAATTDERGCLRVEVVSGDAAPEVEESCQNTGSSLLPLWITGLGGEDYMPTVAVREVDGAWYLSPTTTTTDGLLAVLRSIDSGEFQEWIASIESMENPTASPLDQLEDILPG